jgi:hypothetical protein
LYGAPVSASVVRGASNGLDWRRRGRTWLTEGKVGAATAIDPEAAVVDTPGVVANAGGAADLADEDDVASGADVAPVSPSVIGGASDAPRVARGLCVGWHGCN